MAKKKTERTPIESIRHKDKRKNIPTEELRDFVADEELKPRSMLYPRDPSLDPQLVWKGKDEQDRADLAVPVAPIYIQEKIHPQALVDDVRRLSADFADLRRLKEGEGVESDRRKSAPSVDQYLQPDLFADFNGLPAEFDQRIDFYKHDGHWSNRMILGDSLLVMASLAEKEGLKGKVQTIYMDPPYGIKFGSNWQVSTRKRDVKDGKADDASRQPEQVKAFRDTWQLGIHSYLAYLRDRLVVARELLTETGSIFVQIGDENVHLVRCVMDEIFGSDNGISSITFKKTAGATSEFLPNTADYLLWYAKDRQHMKYRPAYLAKGLAEGGAGAYDQIELDDGKRRRLSVEERERPEKVSSLGRVFRHQILTSPRIREARTGYFPVELNGRTYLPTSGEWKTHKEGISRLVAANRVAATGSTLCYVRFIDDFPAYPLTNVWDDTQSGSAMEKVYVVQTSARIGERCILMTTDPGDLVLDPTCGSGTTAYVAEQWGRRWITCDTSRVALALARTRLMAAKFPYYYLADDYPQITQSSADEEIRFYLRQSAKSAVQSVPDIKKGFVYKRVPHVTLKSIANNPDIKEGMTRQQIDAAIARHADTETLFDQPYEDNKRIRVCGPFSVESLSPHRTISAEEKQRNAEVGTQHGFKMRVVGPDNFGHMILDNLRKAGVQNTRKGERLKFDTLDVYPGEWIHGAGTYTERIDPQISPIHADLGKDKDLGLRKTLKSADENSGDRKMGPQITPMDADLGRNQDSNLRKSAQSVDEKSLNNSSEVVRRAAICIGPEHGTVGATLIKEAAKEAVKGVGFDVLIVCGFAFDPSVTEEAKRYGKLIVLPAKMNPDLAMGEELLKKTGAGNLFMIFGEPDVEIRRIGPQITPMNADLKKNQKSDRRKSAQAADMNDSVPGSVDQIVVEVKGLDVYDPTTGAIRNSSTDDIACWFIDTDYNGESFFVRHAYFTGADEPYEKLKRALRAEIDEAAWSSLYSTTSRPFDVPASGKIAVKVINHFGDEVLKVFEVR